MFTFGNNNPEKAANPPKGQCSQCWAHAYNGRSIHKPGEDCPQCVDHMINGHGNMIVT